MNVTKYLSKDYNTYDFKEDNKFTRALKEHLLKKKIKMNDYVKIVKYVNNPLINKMSDINGILTLELKKYINLSVKHHISSIDDVKIIGNNITGHFKDKYSDDQKIALDKIFKFLYDPKSSFFKLCGYAGTGKTTLISEIISCLVKNKLLNSVALTAPTHQAVKILDCKMNSLFEDRNIQDCMTIHKLLQYSDSFDKEGNRIFVKYGRKNKMLGKYDLVIIDETSMIGKQLLLDIINEINKHNEKEETIIKVIFVGDPAQLTPVNENISPLFSKDGDKYIDKKMSYILKTVVRSNDKDVIGLCTEIRKWISGEVSVLNISKYQGKKVHFYNFKNEKIIKMKWMKRYISKKYCRNSIILTWTNNQSNTYNNIVRRKIMKKDEDEKLDQIEIGDKLIFSDYYQSVDEEPISFYTSDQIIVSKKKIITKQFDKMTPIELSDEVKMKDMKKITADFTSCIDDINKATERKYKILVTTVKYISNKGKETQAKLYILHDKDKKTWEIDRKYANEQLTKLVNKYVETYSESIKQIDKHIITPLWKQYNRIFIKPFASVDYGNSKTCHKSQGSTYYNVFVDMNDIMTNKDVDDMRRCLYVACTRTSNELHILLPKKN